MRSRLFGSPGNFEGDVAESVIPIALIIGVAVDVLLSHALQQLQGVVNVAFIQGNLDQERSVLSLLQEREQLRSKSLPAIKPPRELVQLLVAHKGRPHAEQRFG